jgi:hypothetical protein
MLLAGLMAAESQRADGVGSGTKGKEESIENSHNLFLQDLPPSFRTRLFDAFAAALRR